MLIRALTLSFALLAACAAKPPAYNLSDPLPSWNPGPVKQRIQVFVKEITDPQSASFVQPEDRIAVFDNDGTLWCEKPIYIQLAFIVSRLRILASERPELQSEQPFKAAWEGDMAYLEGLDVLTILSSALSAHAGMTQTQFMRWAKGFLDGAKHPRFQVPYRRLVYQPMRELMDYLRSAGFRVFICTGGGMGFVRSVSPEVYGMPRQNVIGSSTRLEYRIVDGVPDLVRLPEVQEPLNDGPGKPVNFWLHVGRKPIFAVGNSDGDLELLEYTQAPHQKAMAMLLVHDDAEREYAYDEGAQKVRAAARDNNWAVASMKSDFRVMFAFQQTIVPGFDPRREDGR